MPYYYWSKKMLALFLNLRGSKYIFLLKKKKKKWDCGESLQYNNTFQAPYLEEGLF